MGQTAKRWTRAHARRFRRPRNAGRSLSRCFLQPAPSLIDCFTMLRSLPSTVAATDCNPKQNPPLPHSALDPPVPVHIRHKRPLPTGYIYSVLDLIWRIQSAEPVTAFCILISVRSFLTHTNQKQNNNNRYNPTICYLPRQLYAFI